MESPTPPTIGHLKGMGLRAFQVTCATSSCWHTGVVTFDQAAADDATPFPALARLRRFVCTQCGQYGGYIAPDWTHYRASGNGRKD